MRKLLFTYKCTSWELPENRSSGKLDSLLPRKSLTVKVKSVEKRIKNKHKNKGKQLTYAMIYAIKRTIT